MATPPNRFMTQDSIEVANLFVNNWSQHVSLVPLIGYDFLTVSNFFKQKLRECSTEMEEYKTKLAASEASIKSLKAELSGSNDRLINCQAELRKIITRKNSMENDLQQYQTMFHNIRQCVSDGYQPDSCILEAVENILSTFDGRNRLQSVGNVAPYEASTKHSATSSQRRVQWQPLPGDDIKNVLHNNAMDSKRSDEIDYDNTVDSVNESANAAVEAVPRRSGVKRRSYSMLIMDNSYVVFGAPLSPNGQYPIAKVERKNNSGSVGKPLNRSTSESQMVVLNKPKVLVPRFASTLDCRPSKQTRSWTRGAAIDGRVHTFKPIRVVWENCDVCHKRFGIAKNSALICSECNTTIHKRCRQQITMPCVPLVNTPKMSAQKRYNLKDFCPTDRPMVPRILIYCCTALMGERMLSERIYDPSASTEVAKKMFAEFFRANNHPSFIGVDAGIISKIIIVFLEVIRDNIIPSSSFDEIYKAVKNDNMPAVVTAILDFPAPNFDSLAFLMKHFKDVLKHSENKLTVAKLTQIVAPALVGYSRFDVPSHHDSNGCLQKQYSILEYLFKLPEHFWNLFDMDDAKKVISDHNHLIKSSATLTWETFSYQPYYSFETVPISAPAATVPNNNS